MMRVYNNNNNNNNKFHLYYLEYWACCSYVRKWFIWFVRENSVVEKITDCVRNRTHFQAFENAAVPPVLSFYSRPRSTRERTCPGGKFARAVCIVPWSLVLSLSWEVLKFRRSLFSSYLLLLDRNSTLHRLHTLSEGRTDVGAEGVRRSGKGEASMATVS